MRWLLLPLSLLYWVVTSTRNFLYDKGWLKSFEFDFPIILIGNLSTGGTGKTPHVEYLIRLLSSRYKVCTLSRGYGRKMRGYGLATELSLVEDVGDEPKQFKQKFPDAEVAVSEDRVAGVYYLLQDEPGVGVILMDDGFQHRRIKPGCQILLTAHDHLFSHDFILPAGNLREPVSGKKRAQAIVVTKCPTSLTSQSAEQIAEELKLNDQQQLFFTTQEFETYRPLFNDQPVRSIPGEERVLLITGIADASTLKDYIGSQYNLIRSVSFSDHHYYTESDIGRMGRETKYIITTEKDAMRLMEQRSAIEKYGLSVFVVPVSVRFLFDGATRFNRFVLSYVEGYPPREN